jgi:glutaredoxin-like protein
MPILEEKDRQKVSEILSKGMKDEVKLVVFTQEFECDFCKETREIAEELASINRKIAVETFDLLKDSEKAKEYGVERIPALVVKGDGGNGVRYFGIPSGYEFSGLLEDIIDASQRKTRLSEEIVKKVRDIDRDVHIQVFVTPTCPYCPRAVRTAHQMAMLNGRIKADMVESMEFPELANKFDVMAVPKIVINEKVSFEGALPETEFLDYVLSALS